MKRTHAFLITLFLWVALGAGASVMVFHSKDVSIETIAQQPSATETKTDTETAETETFETETAETETETIEVETETPEATEISFPEPEEEALEPVSPAEPKHPFTVTVTNITSKLHIRKQPSTDAEIIGYLHSGDSGECTIIDNHWVMIEYKQGDGYLSRKYITLDE